MVNKTISTLLAAAFIIAAAACSKEKTAAEKRAEEDRLWREAQRSKAIKYYTELTETFPDSEYAPEAKARLAAMGAEPGASGAKKK